MIAPTEVFALESQPSGIGDNYIWWHKTKGPMVFLELEHAKQALIDGGPKFESKWSVAIVKVNPELDLKPFTYWEGKDATMKKLPTGAMFLSDLRDQVAMASNTGESVLPDVPTDDEYLSLRAKLKELGVNVRAVRKLPKLREMLKEAEAKAEVVTA